MQSAARPTPPLPASLRHLPVAHRALHDRARGIIENSPSAIEAAIRAGYAIDEFVAILPEHHEPGKSAGQLHRIAATENVAATWSETRPFESRTTTFTV